MAADLPSGTVTFLFTDIEGSTRLLQELGDDYAGVLVDHRRAVREVLSGYEGFEVDTQGDAFFAAFASARNAAAAAAGIQRALADCPARVRIGLHTGEASVGADGYVGIDVHRAARISAAAHGGQILISQSTRDLIDAPTRDLGEHRLQDLTAPQRLYQLLVDGLPSEFPPPRTLDAASTNLPVEPSALVGRERELREAGRLLERDDVRLLTLTGPAGAGKTRLALQLAADHVGAFEDGVFLVDLSPLRDSELVVPTIAQTVGLRDVAGRPATEALAEFLGEKRILLVVDNVEQVVASAPELARLLAACRRLEVLATSREPLRLSGEQEYPVPPLSTAESVELFAERARAVRPGFDLDGNRSTVAEICVRLDGLPLAIELAASRVKLLPPPKLLERLDQRLALLTGGARDAPERQQTLRAAIDWSFDLLEPDERGLFARVSVFEGGCTLEAAEAVCDATIDGLASLVDKSLLAEREGAAGEPRFVMLETVREYARERLGDDEVEVRRRHAEYFLTLMHATQALGQDTPEALRVYSELANARAAVQWFRGGGDVESELRLGSATLRSLWTRGIASEVLGWLESALERGEDIPKGLRAEGHGAAAFAAFHAGETSRSRRHAEQSLAFARELGDKRQIEWALRVRSFEEEDPNERLRLLQECETLLRELGDDEGLAWVTLLRGELFSDERQLAATREHYERAAGLFERLGLRWEAANARVMVGVALEDEGRHEAAGTVVEDALRTVSELGTIMSIAECFEVLAAARVEADASLATRLLAGAARIRRERREPGERAFRRLVASTEAAAREQLGEGFEREWEAGWALTVPEAVALALADSR
jgi:predicted ATPase/class 3 adenylate cyclase